MKKILNEGNQIHNFISSSGSGTVINFGFGSDFYQVTVPVPLVKSYGSGSTHCPSPNLATHLNIPVFSTGSSGSGGEVDPAGNQSGNKSDLLDDEEDFFDFISRNQFHFCLHCTYHSGSGLSGSRSGKFASKWYVVMIWRKKNQCSGSGTFWYGSGSSDPCLWLTDPDPY